MGNNMVSSFLTIVIIFLSGMIVFPLVKRKFGKKVALTKEKNFQSLRNAIFSAANSMLSSRRIVMSFNDDKSLYALLAGVKDRVVGKSRYQDYKYFNFPVAFLMLGALDHYAATKIDKALKDTVLKCDGLLDETGCLKFSIDKIDQATFGLVFLRLYELTNETRYLTGAKKIYESLQVFKDDEGLYRYRLGIDIYFIDTVGLLCPFLVRYSEIFDVSSVLVEADNQVTFALENCVEPHYGLVYHAFDMKKEQPLGSVNWSRGLGWLLLGLAAVVRVGGPPAFSVALHRYAALLKNLKEAHGYWPQFLGHTNDIQIDSSGTLMFIYAFQKSRVWNFDVSQVLSLAEECVDLKGRVMQSSGDTIYINKYSRIKGPSEMSQGLMLSVMAGAGR